MLLELTRNFIAIGNRRHQEAICNLARALSSAEALGMSGLADLAEGEDSKAS